PSSDAGVAAAAADDDPARAGESSTGAAARTPAAGVPARPRGLRDAPHDGGVAQRQSSGGDPERPRGPSTHEVGRERVRGREAQRGGRNANSINVDLSKVDAVVAKVTELAAHRVSAQGMVGQLLATAEDARRNVARLHSVAMQISNECTSILPEETTHDD